MHRSTCAHRTIALAIVSIFLVACGGNTEGDTKRTPGVSGDTIYIGALTPLSDAVAVIGKPLLGGLTAYFDKVNAEEGGIGGKYKVKIVAEDITYANPSSGAQKYQKIKDKVAMFANVLGTDQVNGILPLLAEDSIIAMPTTFDAEWVRNENLLPWGTPYQLQAINGVGYALTDGGLSGKTVCAMALATGYGRATVEGVEYLAKEMNFKTGAIISYKQDDQDFMAPVTQLKNAGCAIILLAALPSLTGKILGTAAQLGYEPRWIATNPSWNQALLSSPIKDYIIRNLWITLDGPQIGDTTVAGMRTMLAAQAKYSPGQSNDYYYYSGYISAFAVHAMLEKAVASGNLTRAGFFAASRAFPSTTSDGLYGEYTYGAVASRNPPRSGSIFRPNPNARVGLAVERTGVSVPAAKSYQFVKR